MKKKNVKRSFILGSEWLYVKIYAGLTTCDDLLIDVIYPLSLQLERKGLISKWFFIRYSDPDFHIRYRLLLENCDDLFKVVSLFNLKIKRYIDDSLVYRVCYDTYEREVERYGIGTIENTESLFFENSKLICNILKFVKETNENYRWMSAFLLIDSFLSKFNMTLEEKYDLIALMDRSYKTEFGFGLHNSKQLNVLFRNKKKLIFDLMKRKVVNDDFSLIYRYIDDSLGHIDILSEDINKSSCIHMMMNRLFVIKNRMHELLVYNFICRYYKSMMAIERDTK